MLQSIAGLCSSNARSADISGRGLRTIKDYGLDKFHEVARSSGLRFFYNVGRIELEVDDWWLEEEGN